MPAVALLEEAPAVALLGETLHMLEGIHPELLESQAGRCQHCLETG